MAGAAMAGGRLGAGYPGWGWEPYGRGWPRMGRAGLGLGDRRLRLGWLRLGAGSGLCHRGDRRLGHRRAAARRLCRPARQCRGYCMRRFKSYNPATGTYLGYDGRRHRCPDVSPHASYRRREDMRPPVKSFAALLAVGTLAAAVVPRRRSGNRPGWGPGRAGDPARVPAGGRGGLWPASGYYFRNNCGGAAATTMRARLPAAGLVGGLILGAAAASAANQARQRRSIMPPARRRTRTGSPIVRRSIAASIRAPAPISAMTACAIPASDTGRPETQGLPAHHQSLATLPSHVFIVRRAAAL